MANTAIKKLDDCTDLQKKFIAALVSEEAMEIPRKGRMRWCATQAGYPENASLASIVAPLKDIVKECVTEAILVRASINAAWTLAEMSGDALIDSQSRDRMAASNSVLDRVIPKKEAEGSKMQQPIAILVLPAKNLPIQLQEAKVIEHEDVSPIKEG